MDVFDRFRARLGKPDMLHQGMIGRDAVIEGPFGPKPMVYADYIASGRALRQVEECILEEVLPWYANSHTEASHCGAVMTRLRRQARAEILRCVCGGEEHAVVFTGSGATAGLNRLAHLFGIDSEWTVLIGPYEHHSNILVWRESGARVVELPEARDGGLDIDALMRGLSCEGPVLGAFSAASNVTGVLSDVRGVTGLMRAAGARVIWDYAGGAPYLPIDMSAGMDAVVVSPHKFLGGPGASGVMIVRRDAVTVDRPSMPGGGTVRFVNDAGHDYATSIEAREEGGTPNVVGDIRAALVFALKDAVGQEYLDSRHREWLRQARRLWSVEGLEMLGHATAPRLPILSFRIRDGNGGYVHQQLATRQLSDRYGVQARGGCACAGPYVHRLLDIGAEESENLRAAILRGEEIEKPGFVRLNLCWAAPEAEIDHILDSVCDLAATAGRYRARYLCDPTTAIFTPIAA
ncbi:aminotransferase class V-fold PLP-dependent enzyme [Paracoccus sp. Z330]|uniref:Aminotransferase class V-fold PLP-dependent enzyme n=1 Tax=Paracoccus onchidii TaxID=3017813 RepID=A0ABT4ZJ45_9RHOB|nr:aminotransferase class V-fold PLP-dependent enzyme [Paracoccus onchidii]MDB6179375.1 aminotransferase class V-fold PLP-dependent enzyme [Paracoccus onchidii]